MTNEDKQLLLKDLSARLPYGVICKVEFKDSEGWKIQNMSLKGVFINECYFTSDTGSICSKEFKPYLRPMSSMTEEEKRRFYDICTTLAEDKCHFIMEGFIDSNFMLKKFSYLNSIHVDYRGLIPKDLAIKAPKYMYKL